MTKVCPKISIIDSRFNLVGSLGVQSPFSEHTYMVVVGDTQSDSIQYLNFAKKGFIQYSIQYCFTQDSIHIIQFKINSGDSIQKIIQFNSQGMIITGRIGKVPNNWPKSVQNRKKGDFSSKTANIDSKIELFIHFTIKFNSKYYSISIFLGIFNSKKS